jgi:hypothetical protein
MITQEQLRAKAEEIFPFSDYADSNVHYEEIISRMVRLASLPSTEEPDPSDYVDTDDNKTGSFNTEAYERDLAIYRSKEPNREPSLNVDEIESNLVDEICRQFETIGIDTSEWEYKFGNGNFAAEFIKAGIQSHLEKITSPAPNKEEGQPIEDKDREISVQITADENAPKEALKELAQAGIIYAIISKHLFFQGGSNDKWYLQASLDEYKRSGKLSGSLYVAVAAALTEYGQQLKSAQVTDPGEMNIDLLREKMDRFFNEVTPDQLVDHLESLGYRFEKEVTDPEKVGEIDEVIKKWVTAQISEGMDTDYIETKIVEAAGKVGLDIYR